ncbi:MAG: tetratricopeptide repeat protein [Micrococcales bacterium]|nr:tetratricopeptide repeat protein [Micrococcales bacterium]MCL2668839.1 tetratricopeptide repeat protein [Micrococcales bacterium]
MTSSGDADRSLPDGEIDRCLGLADLFLSHGRPERALDVLGDAVRNAPDHPRGLQLTALAQARLGDATAAREAADRLLVLRPYADWAYYTLSQVLSQADDRDGALAAARRAVELDPADLWNHGRVARLAPDNSDEARHAAAEMLRLAPQHPEPHTVSAVVALSDRRLDDAERHVADALAIDPTYQEALETHPRIAGVRALTSLRPASVAAWLDAEALVAGTSPGPESLDEHRTSLLTVTIAPPALVASLGLSVVPGLWTGEWLNPGRAVAGLAVLTSLLWAGLIWVRVDRTVRDHVRAALAEPAPLSYMLVFTVSYLLLVATAVCPDRWTLVPLLLCGATVIVAAGVLSVYFLMRDDLRTTDSVAGSVIAAAFFCAVIGIVWLLWAFVVRAAVGTAVWARVVLLVPTAVLIVYVARKIRRALAPEAQTGATST